MSVPRVILLMLVDYTNWANQRVLELCAPLSTEQLERDLGASHVSVLRTLTHLYYAERVWLERLRENAMPPLDGVGTPRFFDDIASQPDFTTLQQSWPVVSHGLRLYVETEPDLDGEIRGSDHAIPRWKLLLHVINHATGHRGQVISMLRQLGMQPRNVDLFEFHLLHP